MGDLAWKRNRNKVFCYPLAALRHHAVALGSSGSGKTETLFRTAYGAKKVYQLQVVYLDAKGETKRDEEQGQDNAARFVATMHAAGADTVKVFPSLYYNGWQGSPAELKNRLLSVIDYSESAYYGDVASNALDLALHAPTTPRSSAHFLANLRFDRLKAMYQRDPLQYQRVLNLNKKLLEQVEMRYQVFFSAMAGQLDGTLDYADADAVYLRVRGFALRNEAPRLGRFLIYDFMHYLAERRRPGTQTLLIIDEFNALRMREETSVLFEQARSFGGSLIISSQGYTGLGPREYADRILDACSTYILHACSDPFPVSKRAGKRLRIDTSWSEDAEGEIRTFTRPRWDWRVPENAVLQQATGQAYWIYRGRTQQVQSAQVPITLEQVQEGWAEIQHQEHVQRDMVEEEKQRKQQQKAQSQAQQKPDASFPETPPVADTSQSKPRTGRTSRPPSQQKTKKQKHVPTGSETPDTPVPQKPSEQISSSLPQGIPSVPNPDDDEPDEL